MAPVNSNTCQILRLSKAQKRSLPKRFFENCVRKISKLRSVLKTNKQVRNTSEDPLNKKQVRFAVPLDDSRNFKGFTTNQLIQIDEKLLKMATIRKALDLKQKTAVWKTMRKNHGVVPIKNGSTKYFLCSKKLCPMPIRAEKKIVAQPVSTISQQDKLLPNNLKIANMIMMECRVCSRKAYFPNTQPNISSVNLNLFICNDCFLKSKSMISKTSMPFVPKTVKEIAVLETNSDDELEDKPIIITSVRSLSTQNALECQDKEIKPVIDVIDLEPISTSMQHEKMNETPSGNNDDDDVQDLSAVRDVKTEKEESGHGKKVTVRTSEGYFTFIVPDEFEDQTDSFELLSGQRSGTADDPILIDDL